MPIHSPTSFPLPTFLKQFSFNIVNTLLCKLNNLSIFWITLPVICIYNSIYYLICKYSFVNFYLLYSFYWNYLYIMYKKQIQHSICFLLFFFQIFRNRFNNNSRFKRFCKMFIHTCLNSSETILRKRICSHCDNRYCLCVLSAH